MREILFRGKTINPAMPKKWVYGYYHKEFADIITQAEGGDIDGKYEDYKVNGITVGQFIGKTDKYGTKIFEHDILQIGNYRHVVVWDEDRAAFGLMSQRDYLHRGEEDYFPYGTSVPAEGFWQKRQSRIEVIGNIIDNLELLKEKMVIEQENLYRGKAQEAFPTLNIKIGDWVYGYLEHCESGHLMIGNKYVDPKTCGRFIGLRDVKGARIFEGDILQGDKIMGIIKWEDGRRWGCFCPGLYFVFEITEGPAKGKRRWKRLDDYEARHCTVIGNIHDNPELIK